MERSRTTCRSALFAVCVASAGLVSGLSGGCAGPGNFVWVNDLPPAATAPSPDGDYVIRDGDLVNIKVLTQEPLSTRARVRSDGRIAMPAIGDVEVRGKTEKPPKGGFFYAAWGMPAQSFAPVF